MMMIRTVRHESYPLLKYILKFYFNSSPSHRTIEHHNVLNIIYYIIIYSVKHIVMFNLIVERTQIELDNIS